MKKKVLFLMVILSLFLCTSVSADTSVKIEINGDLVEFNEEYGRPFIDQNNRTQVPFRVTMETFGAEVDWNNETRTAIAKKDGIVVEAPIGKDYIIKNGNIIKNDTSALIKDGRTYLPIRAVLEAFDTDVDWDNQTRTVVVQKGPKATQEGQVKIIALDKEAEYVTIENIGSSSIDISGWKMVSVRGQQSFTFPTGYILQPGQRCKLTSGAIKGTGDFTMANTTIWNNSESDPAELYDNKGVLIDRYED